MSSDETRRRVTERMSEQAFMSGLPGLVIGVPDAVDVALALIAEAKLQQHQEDVGSAQGTCRVCERLRAEARGEKP
jgi:hypothetical protein